MANDGKLHTISRQQLVEPGMDANHHNPAKIFLNHIAPLITSKQAIKLHFFVVDNNINHDHHMIDLLLTTLLRYKSSNGIVYGVFAFASWLAPAVVLR